jgi:hypothetical protein
MALLNDILEHSFVRWNSFLSRMLLPKNIPKKNLSFQGKDVHFILENNFAQLSNFSRHRAHNLALFLFISVQFFCQPFDLCARMQATILQGTGI